MPENRTKLKEAFDEILASNLHYNKQIQDIDYTVLVKAMSSDKIWKVLGCDVVMFNYLFDGCPSVLIIFSYYPKGDSGSKHVSEKTIDIISLLQDTFVFIDYADIITAKAEPYVYIVAVKKI
jgi:hypothetical protein